MAKAPERIIIKKYANRRLYNTGTSTYVTLEDLAVMVKDEEDFIVIDAKTSDDITRSVLTQIIFEQEAKGQTLLPVKFLRNLIQVYGDSVQTIVPSYLEHSMESFREQQDKFREQIATGFAPATGLEMISEQTKRNTEIFQNAMSMFMPFGGLAKKDDDEGENQKPASQSAQADDVDLDKMKKQLAEMQAQIKALDKG
ncbi:MAG: polyhydroxyalkanoate synthesis repressor PhaR [Hyphomicrobiales bacterium]